MDWLVSAASSLCVSQEVVPVMLSPPYASLAGLLAAYSPDTAAAALDKAEGKLVRYSRAPTAAGLEVPEAELRAAGMALEPPELASWRASHRCDPTRKPAKGGKKVREQRAPETVPTEAQEWAERFLPLLGEDGEELLQVQEDRVS